MYCVLPVESHDWFHEIPWGRFWYVGLLKEFIIDGAVRFYNSLSCRGGFTGPITVSLESSRTFSGFALQEYDDVREVRNMIKGIKGSARKGS